jgi:2-polyprenyl-3-methyl-5-hydroxy-6-metoxy-1,4-benzoquinol methylase
MQQSSKLQSDIRSWWEVNPMTYDWRKTLSHEEGTREFYEAIDNRFWKAAWFAHEPNEQPFNHLINYDDLRGKRVLEVGCGSGAISAQLARNEALVTAIDLTSHAVALTRRRFELFGLQGDVRQMDAEHMELPNETFDFIWSWGVIHHSANTEAIIAEMHRVLKPGGEIRLMVYHRHSIKFWVGTILIRGLLFGGLLRYSAEELCNKYSDGLIAKHYSSGQLSAMLEKLFRDIRIDIYGQKEELWQIPGGRLKSALLRMTPNSIANWLTRRFGWFLFARATK